MFLDDTITNNYSMNENEFESLGKVSSSSTENTQPEGFVSDAEDSSPQFKFIKSINDEEICLAELSELPKLTQSSSILKGSPGFRERERKDSCGQLILKAGKEHKISFRENIMNVHIVENWKEYNIFDEEEDE